MNARNCFEIPVQTIQHLFGKKYTQSESSKLMSSEDFSKVVLMLKSNSEIYSSRVENFSQSLDQIVSDLEIQTNTQKGRGSFADGFWKTDEDSTAETELQELCGVLWGVPERGQHPVA